MTEPERETERDRQKDRVRETDRHTHIHTDRQIETEGETETDRERQRHEREKYPDAPEVISVLLIRSGESDDSGLISSLVLLSPYHLFPLLSNSFVTRTLSPCGI